MNGGGTVTLADDAMADYSAVTWLDDNTIVYGAEGNRLKRISAGGTGNRILRQDPVWE